MRPVSGSDAVLVMLEYSRWKYAIALIVVFMPSIRKKREEAFHEE